MKIAFKHNAQVKIYRRDLEMESIRDFIKKHFGLQQHSYTLAFQDSDKDMITISSNEDLSMLKELEDTSKLIKISIQPTSEAVPSKEAEIELLKPQTQAQTQPQAEAQFQTLKEEEKVIEPTQEKQNNKHRWGHKKGEWHQRCHRGQNKQDKQHLSKGKSHQKHSSSSSQQNQEGGNQISEDQKRFQEFLGQKVGKFVQRIGPQIYQFLNKEMNKNRHQGNKHGKIYKLSRIFGGEPEAYKEFVEKNKTIQKRELINKYGEESGLKREEVQARIADFKSKKLGKWFQLDPEHFKEFVLVNIDLPAKALMQMQVQKGLQLKGKFNEKREGKCWKESKDKRHRLSKDKQRCDNSGQRSEKGRILQSLVDLFGTGNVKQFYKLIEQHFSEGEEAIIERCLAARSSA